MIFLTRFLGRILAALAISVGALVSHAQKVTEPVDLNARDPRLQEGKLFVVRLFPAGKNLEVEISGRTAATVSMDDLGLRAQAFIGSRVVDLTPKQVSKNPLRFRFESLDPKDSRLEVEVKTSTGKEKFEFKDLR
jgi:hypothetical protein